MVLMRFDSFTLDTYLLLMHKIGLKWIMPDRRQRNRSGVDNAFDEVT
jgi:hypothetical protein